MQSAEMPARTQDSLFQQIITELWSIPKRCVVWAALAGALSEIFDIVGRKEGQNFTTLDLIGLIATLIVWFFVTYAISMQLISQRVSVRGAVSFSLTSLVAAAPLALLLGGLWLLPAHSGSSGVLAVVLLAMIAALILLPLLAAWPVAQTISRTFVSPLRILRATHGKRWSLILIAYAATGLNKIVPPLSKTHNSVEVVLIALGNVAVGCVTLLLASCIAVAAWKFACRNDLELGVGAERYG